MKPLVSYLSFTGQTDCYAELPLDVLAGATDFTIEVKLSTTSTKNTGDAWTWGTIAGRKIPYFGKDDFGFCVNNGKLCFWCSPASKGTSNSNTQAVTSSVTVNDGEIHKVAVVSSNGAIDLYCDGVNVAHTDNVNAKITDAQTILLAYDSDSNSYLQMDLYEARFWNVARSAAEIFADITGTETGLQGWYLPTAEGLKDYSGNDRHATLYGSPAYTKPTLKVWLPFDESATFDRCGGTWTATGTPVIENSALKLDGASYLKMTEPFEFTGQPFTVSCKFSGTSNTTGGDVCLWQMYIGNSKRIQLGIETSGKLDIWKDRDSTVYIRTAASVLDGQIHHAECDFDGATWYLFLDGVLIGTQAHTGKAQDYSLYIGVNYQTNRRFTGTVDEFQIYDNIALHTENFTPPTSADYAELSLSLGYPATLTKTFDVERKVAAPVQVNFDVQRVLWQKWFYYNAGSADTLTISGTTLTNLPATKSKTGSAFYQTARQKCFDLPSTNEIWIKFDVYFDGENRWRAYNDGANGTTGITAQTTTELSFFSNGTNVQQLARETVAKNQLQTVLLHMISGTTDGIIEAWVDDVFIYQYEGDVNHGELFEDLYLQSDGSGTFFSNVIISNSEIDFCEGFQIFSADVERRVSNAVEVSFDVQRKVNNVFDLALFADVMIKDVLSLTLSADIERRTTLSFELDCDLELLDVISVEFLADIKRAVPAKLVLFPTDTSKYFSGDSQSSSIGGGQSSTPVVIPPLEDIPSPINNTEGLQSLEIVLAEQQVSPQYNFTGIRKHNILDVIAGNYLDYSYDVVVEKRRQEGVLYSYNCFVDLNKLLYEQIKYTTKTTVESDSDDTDKDTEPKYISASEHAKKIAKVIGLTAKISFKDFTSTVLAEDMGGATYADYIRDIFGWTSRVPHKLINIFEHDGYLYFVQRGSEENKINISHVPHSTPVITQEYVRIFWGSSPDTKTEITSIQKYNPKNHEYPQLGEIPGLDISDLKEELETPVTYPYSSSQIHDSNKIEKVESNYTYNDENLISRSETITQGTDGQGTRVVTEYYYEELPSGRKFLAREIKETYTINGSFESYDGRTIIEHSPLMQGQEHVAKIDEDGDATDIVGQALPNARVSPYLEQQWRDEEKARKDQIKQEIYDRINKWGQDYQEFYQEYHDNIKAYIDALGDDWETSTKTKTINGWLPYDASFPVYDEKSLRRITKWIKDLNGTIKETVNVSIYNYPHLINFNDAIFFNNEYYFLVNNTPRTTARIFNEQNLTLVRWIGLPVEEEE